MTHTVEALREALPAYAKDIKLNLSSVLTPEGAPDLTINQIMGVALACAYTTRNADVIRAVSAEASAVLSDLETNAAKTAATIMAMNNIYYRFTHLVNDEEITKLPAKLRMNAMVGHGIPKVDFELYALAVSAINGCGMCMESHVHEVTKAGVTKLGVQSAIRIASVVNATAQAMVA